MLPIVDCRLTRRGSTESLHDPAQRFYTSFDKNNARPIARQTSDTMTTASTK
ncbi:hypothetical protein ACFFYR_29280 [Paraburkholderia dipogonis]|uniref:hypothetical protein n=1 Tax=Paraburkholderia dipogonis TaxID=1211383 RepID=UPI001AD84B4C|nr:hypothetical protein [Paraburkholderia dipogonis]